MVIDDWGWLIPATAWILIPLGGMAVGVVVHWLRTKERLLAIEKGVALPPEPVHPPRDPWELAANFRIGGLITAAVGVGLFGLLLALAETLPGFPRGVMAVALIPFLVGVALLYEYRTRVRELGQRPRPPV
jgi:hypothetical protein